MCAGERDVLVRPGRAGLVPGRYRDIAHQLAKFPGQSVQRSDGHFPGVAAVTRFRVTASGR